jgi:hypothetical protein
MARRHVVKKVDVLRRRALAWEQHYGYRELLKVLPIDSARVMKWIQNCVPEHEMTLDGFLYRPLDVVIGQGRARREIAIPGLNNQLMCLWYWHEEFWMIFVRLFNALPDVVEDHYWLYDVERDGSLLMPMSSKAKRGDVPVPVDKRVENHRYNSGTSEGKVSRIRYNSVNSAVEVVK